MTAKLTGEEYNTLIRHVVTVDLKRLEFQRALDAIVATRDAYYAQLAPRYELPATFGSLRWNDETLEIEVS